MPDPVHTLERAEIVVEAARQDIALALHTVNTGQIAYHLQRADKRLASVRTFLRKRRER